MIIKKLLPFVAAYFISMSAFATYDVTGNANPCANTTGSDTDPHVYTYSLSDIPSGAFNVVIQWSFGNANFVGALHDATINLWWPNNACSYFGSVNVSGIDYDITMPPDGSHQNPWTKHVQDNNTHYLSVSINSLPAITANGTWIESVPVCNTNNITYSINSACGATSYQWSIPTGWAAQTNLTGTSITVTPDGSSGGVISVVATNSSNGCNLTQTYSKTVTRTAQQPSFSNTISQFCTPNTPAFNLNISAVPNASSYTWTIPSNPGWLMITRGHPLYATVDFEGVAGNGVICVKSNFSCGQSSNPACFNISAYNVIPTVPSAEPSYTVNSTIDPTKKAITSQFPAWSNPYTWSGTPSGNTTTYFGGNSGTCNFIMTNNQTVQFNYTASNACGNSTPTDGFLYKLVNGSLVRQPLQRDPQKDGDVVIAREKEMQLFPNPAENTLNIECFYNEQLPLSFILIDAFGNELLKSDHWSQIGKNNFNLKLNDVGSGIYYLKMNDPRSATIKKIVVCR